MQLPELPEWANACRLTLEMRACEGAAAAQLLLERLGAATGPAQRVIVPTRLILGGSCGPPR